MSAHTSPGALIRRALLNGQRRPRTPGSSPTSKHGDGYEFVELRAYVPGDDVRRIDWAASARSVDLQTRVILEEVSLTLGGIVDDTPSMRVGRRRPLLVAAYEALRAWYDLAGSDDRCVRVVGDAVYPARGERGAASAIVALQAIGSFDLTRSLRVARSALRPGAALLAIGDWFDLQKKDDSLLHALSKRCDCTALIARDPWYDGLPLAGVVRMQGAEGGTLRAYIGGRERQAYARAVREREAELLKRFAGAGWRAGLLFESNGVASLAAAFGLRRAASGPEPSQSFRSWG